METDISSKNWSVEDMEKRLVRYDDLRPCYNAFIDTRSPGSEAKENFTIIGGVSENPDQYVHIAEPHGFNIGAARQPPQCVNSQHSHKSAEVFVVHSGSWRFDLGEKGDDAQVTLHPGDVISIPINIFRGFTNVGDDIGTLWAVLGNDDPGRVTWAPYVFDMAKDYGLVLLENGSLVDLTKGETIPEGMKAMAPTNAEEVAQMTRVSPEDAKAFVWENADHDEAEKLIIGEGAPIDWEHGFTLSRFAPGQNETVKFADDAKVFFVQKGQYQLSWAQGALDLGAGDTITIPKALAHDIKQLDADAIGYIVRRTA